MLQIPSATTSSGLSIPQLMLTNFTRDGRPIAAREALNQVAVQGGQTVNARVEGDTVICEVACGFAQPSHATVTPCGTGVSLRSVGVTVPARVRLRRLRDANPVTLNLTFDPAP